MRKFLFFFWKRREKEKCLKSAAFQKLHGDDDSYANKTIRINGRSLSLPLKEKSLSVRESFLSLAKLKSLCVYVWFALCVVHRILSETKSFMAKQLKAFYSNFEWWAIQRVEFLSQTSSGARKFSRRLQEARSAFTRLDRTHGRFPRKIEKEY